MPEENTRFYEFGPFRLDAQKRLLFRGGEVVPLKPKAFDTLLVLIEEPDRVLEKDELMRRIWPDTVVEEGNLTFNISNIRKALGDDPQLHRYIVTIPGKGYRFVAGVEVVVQERRRAHLTIEEEEPSSMAEGGGRRADSVEMDGAAAGVAVRERKSVAAAATGGRVSRRRAVVVIAGLLLAAAVVAVFGSYLYKRAAPRQSANQRAVGVAVALPFSEMKMSRLTSSGKTKHAALSPDGKYVAHVWETAEGQSLWIKQVATSSHIQLVPPAEVMYLGITFSPDGNFVYAVYLERNEGDSVLLQVSAPLGGPAKRTTGEVGPLGFSPDGQRIAFLHLASGTDSSLKIANADGSAERTLAVRRQPDYFHATYSAPAWSPDGKLIACSASLNDARGHYETIILVNLADGTQQQLTLRRWGSVGQLAWLADGSGLIVTASEQASAPQQLWHITYPNGAAMQITNDLNDYEGVSLSADSQQLVTVQDAHLSSVWITAGGEAAQARQVSSEVGRREEIAWTPDSRLVYLSRTGGETDIWSMAADGSDSRQLTVGARANHGLSISPDNRYLVFASDRSGAFNIWRADADGGNLKQLTNGNGDIYPHFSPDNQWIVYQRGYGLVSPSLWRVSIDGGEPVQLSAARAQRPVISPDGQLIAYFFLDPEPKESRWSIGVIPFAGGAPVHKVAFPRTVRRRAVRWTPDGNAVAYIDSPGGVSNIWSQPLDGSPPRRLTDFTADHITAFAWSRDGQRLAVARDNATSDVVMINRAK